MDSALNTAASSLSHFNLPFSTQIRSPSIHRPQLFPLSSISTSLHFSNPSKPYISLSTPIIRVRAASSSNSDPNDGSPNSNNPIVKTLRTTAGALVFSAAAASMIIGKFHHPLPARADTAPTSLSEKAEETSESQSSPLSQFLESNTEAVEALKSLLQQKLENGEDGEALRILRKLSSAQPEHTEWKFLTARLLNEMGETEEARDAFEEILKLSPLSFEALFENALLMDRSGEGEAVIRRLEEALRIAENEKKVKEARDVRLIMAQIQFLQKNVEEALKSYEELEREDPTDFRPYFCKGMIFSLLDRNNEAKEQFQKYRELSPKKFEVEGYLRSPLSRMKLFGTNEDN